MGDGLKNSADGNKSRSLPRVSCQKVDVDSSLINDFSTLPREIDDLAWPRETILSPSDSFFFWFTEWADGFDSTI